jgi:hypothetical protein
MGRFSANKKKAFIKTHLKLKKFKVINFLELFENYTNQMFYIENK